MPAASLGHYASLSFVVIGRRGISGIEGFGDWDAVTVYHSPFTVFYHSDSVSTENHCAALNWVVGVGFPEVETFTVKWVVD